MQIRQPRTSDFPRCRNVRHTSRESPLWHQACFKGQRLWTRSSNYAEADAMGSENRRTRTCGSASSVGLTMQGDRKALEGFLTSNTPQSFISAGHMLANHHDARGTRQVEPLEALLNLNRHRNQSQISTWLTRVAINSALTQLQPKRYVFPASMNQELSQDFQPLANIDPGLGLNSEDLGARDDPLQALEQAFPNLFPLYQRVLWTYVSAQLLRVQIGTLKSRLSPAGRNLRREATKRGFDPRFPGCALSLFPLCNDRIRTRRATMESRLGRMN